MKKIFAAAVVAATFAVSAPAMAATQVDANIPLSQTGPGVFTGTFTNTVTSGDLNANKFYTDTYEFIVPTAGVVGASAITLTFDGSLTFTEVLLNGIALSITPLADGNYTASSPFGGLSSATNPQKLSVTGKLTSATGSYAGSVRFESAVPEPGTWALMILGFGIVGYAMRRRPSVRFAQAI